jgi:YteA family regulatory protein
VLTQDQLSRFRSLLQEQHKELADRLQENDHYQLGLAAFKESLSELSNYDNHPADHGTETFERGKDLALNEHTEEELLDMVRALERIDSGKYGMCEVCGKDIPLERLEALPTATRCIEHAVEVFIPQERPVEEDVLYPPFGNSREEGEDIVHYDAEDSWQDVARYGTSETPSDFYDPSKFSYSEMFIDSDDPVGYVEDIEGFIITDIYGKNVDISTDHALHEQYETRLDEENEKDSLL